jgi:hypothetical protein
LSDTLVNSLVLKVRCGEVLNTTINGTVVQIECGSGGGTFKIPPPPSASGGTVAYATMLPRGGLLDLNALTVAFRNNELDQHARPLAPNESATVVLEDLSGSHHSLDFMLTRLDDV